MGVWGRIFHSCRHWHSAHWLLWAAQNYLREHLYLAAVGILLAAGISAVFQYLNTYLNTKGAESMVKTARDWLFHHIEHLPYEWHMQNQTGDIIQRCTSDVDMVRDFVAEQLIQVVRIAILIGFSIVFMVSMSVRLSVIVFLSVPLIIAYSWFFYYKIGHLFQQCDENRGRALHDHAGEPDRCACGSRVRAGAV